MAGDGSSVGVVAAGARVSGDWRHRRARPPLAILGVCQEGVLLDVVDMPIADRLVEAVRAGVLPVGGEESVAVPACQEGLAERGDAGARVALAASLRRGVDRADPDAVRRRP